MAESVTQSAVRGFAWNAVGIAATRVTTAVGQLVLAWLLTPDDFGLVGLCYTIITLASRIQEMGVRQVLVQRQKRLNRWATPAFWMTLLAGIVVGLLVAATAPLAARLYDEPRLVPLLIVFALASPFDGLYTVPSAVLHGRMRFREMTLASAAVGVGSTVISIVLAALGFGAFSFAITRVIGSAALPAVLWGVTRPRIGLNPQWRLWPYIIGDSTALLLGGLVFSLIGQIDYIALGWFRSTDEVGIYFMAYTLSVQLVMVLALNLTNVLFPALGQLDSSERQLGAAIRALRGLAVIAVPLCFLQALVARPLIEWLFDAEWEPMIPMFQVLSVGMAMRLVAWPSTSILYARRRFRLHLVQQLTYLALLFPGVLLGAWWGGGLGTAVAVAAGTFVIEPVLLGWRLREVGGRPGAIVGVVLPPLGSATIAAALAVAVGQIPGLCEHPVSATVVAALVMSGVYSLLIRYTARSAWSELSMHATALAGRFVRRRAME